MSLWHKIGHFFHKAVKDVETGVSDAEKVAEKFSVITSDALKEAYEDSKAEVIKIYHDPFVIATQMDNLIKDACNDCLIAIDDFNHFLQTKLFDGVNIGQIVVFSSELLLEPEVLVPDVGAYLLERTAISQINSHFSNQLGVNIVDTFIGSFSYATNPVAGFVSNINLANGVKSVADAASNDIYNSPSPGLVYHYNGTGSDIINLAQATIAQLTDGKTLYADVTNVINLSELSNIGFNNQSGVFTNAFIEGPVVTLNNLQENINYVQDAIIMPSLKDFVSSNVMPSYYIPAVEDSSDACLFDNECNNTPAQTFYYNRIPCDGIAYWQVSQTPSATLLNVTALNNDTSCALDGSNAAMFVYLNEDGNLGDFALDTNFVNAYSMVSEGNQPAYCNDYSCTGIRYVMSAKSLPQWSNFENLKMAISSRYDNPSIFSIVTSNEEYNGNLVEGSFVNIVSMPNTIFGPQIYLFNPNDPVSYDLSGVS